MAAGHRTAEALTEPRKFDTGRPYKIPQLMASQEGERTQLMRILVSRGIGGIDERMRGLTQRWFDMVDWRSAQVGSARLGVSRSIEGYARKLVTGGRGECATPSSHMGRAAGEQICGE
jgi:hypothetical protein